MGSRKKHSSRPVIKKCSKKKKKPPLKDKISQLPNDILLLIISFLPLKEAVRSSVLSKRWRNLWMHIPLLHFDATEDLMFRIRNRRIRNRTILPAERCKFVNWVNHALKLHKVQNLAEFRIFFDLGKSAQHEIDKWLEYAISRRVQSLELNLLAEGWLPRRSEHCYTFPNQLFRLSNGTYTTTILPDSHHCGILLPVFAGLKPLKSLSLKSVNVTSEVIQSLLHNCPLLERLVVESCGALVNLAVCGPSPVLKYLEITYCSSLESITISNLNLLSLNLSKPEYLNLSNLPMLTDVCIQSFGYRSFGCNLADYVFSKFSFCLSQLEILSLFTYEEKFIRKPGGFPELPQLKQLLVQLNADADQSLMGITSLIKSCPSLQKLVLEFLRGSPEMTTREFERVKRCTFKSLKTIQVIGYTGRCCEDELIFYLVENAVALKKLTIDPIHWGLPFSRKKSDREKAAGDHAMKQFECVVPPHIELVIL